MNKRVFCLFFILILLLVSCSSFADISKYSYDKIPSFESYMGMWYGIDENTKEYSVSIIYDNSVDSFYTVIVTYDPTNSNYGLEYTNSLIYKYYMTYESSSNEIYLTYVDKFTDYLSYTLKLENGALKLHFISSGKDIPLTKVK